MIYSEMHNSMLKNSFLKVFRCSITFLLVSAFAPMYTLSAQIVYKVNLSGNSIQINGTSNLHEWDSKVQAVTGNLTAITDETVLKQLSQVTIKIPVISIKSGKGIMDTKTYEALKSDKYPTISYQSSSNNLSGSNEITSNGQLTMAGVSKPKLLKVTYVLKDKKITIKGAIKMKMSDFDIKPPTAIFGTLKTGDEVEIVFDVSFIQ